MLLEKLTMGVNGKVVAKVFLLRVLTYMKVVCAYEICVNGNNDQGMTLIVFLERQR